MTTTKSEFLNRPSRNHVRGSTCVTRCDKMHKNKRVTTSRMNYVCQTFFFAKAETWNALSYGYKYTQASLCVGEHSISSTFLLSLSLPVQSAMVHAAEFLIYIYVYMTQITRQKFMTTLLRNDTDFHLSL